ncbi:DUF4112 domain-containing protein [Euzebya sp.]|uniref:DUF4112 domain-containing protein n=1 Tax=Euzebya sp. TaxID=1971409 RepID=UPI003519A84B
MSTSPPPELDAEGRARYRRVEEMARVLDSLFTIPGTDRTVGVDAIIGFIPWVGGAAGLALSAGIIAQGILLGARGATVARMLLNAAADAALNAIPFVGWISDVFFKANERNVRLLRTHSLDPDRTRADSRRILVITVVVLVVVVLVAIAAAVWALVALLAWLF